MANNLTDKQELFCQEYVKDLNGTNAAIRAKYAEKTAASQANRMLKKEKVRQRVAQLMKKRNKKCEVNAKYVLDRLVEIDSLDILDIIEDDLSGIKNLSDWPLAWRRSINAIDLKKIINKKDDGLEAIIQSVKWPDKTKNLQLIGKHTDVDAFAAEKVQIEGADIIIDKLRRARQRLSKAKDE